MFDLVILPLLQQNEGRITKAVSSVEAFLGRLVSSASTRAADAVAAHSSEVLMGTATALSVAAAASSSKPEEDDEEED